jgi:Ca2+-binding RTX toxin-like protein
MKKHLNKKLKRASKSYHIEQLEPRLMMDATVSDWAAESNLIDEHLLPAQYVSSWEDTRIDTVQIEENSLVRRAQVNDLYDEGDIDTSALETIVKNSMIGALNQLKAEYMAAHDGEWDSSHTFSASDIYSHLSNSSFNSNGWSGSFALSNGSIVVSATFHNSKTVEHLSALVAEKISVDVNLVSLDENNVSIEASAQITLNGVGSVDVDNVALDARALFRQVVNNPGDGTNPRLALGNTLEFESVADAANDLTTADYSAGVQANNSSIGQTYWGDLNFNVTNVSSLGSGVSIANPVTYSLNSSLQSPSNMQWSDTTVQILENNLSINSIVSPLYSLYQWLKNNSFVTQDNPSPLLQDTFGGLLNRNATECVPWSELFKGILSGEVKSLQDILAANQNSSGVSLENNVLKIPFSLTCDSNAKTSALIAANEIEKLGFNVVKNPALNLTTSDVSLEFTLEIPIKTMEAASEHLPLENLLPGRFQGTEALWGTSTVVAPSSMAYGRSLTEIGKIKVTDGEENSVSQECQVPEGNISGMSGLLQSTFGGKVSYIMDESNGRYILYSSAKDLAVSTESDRILLQEMGLASAAALKNKEIAIVSISSTAFNTTDSTIAVKLSFDDADTLDFEFLAQDYRAASMDSLVAAMVSALDSSEALSGVDVLCFGDCIVFVGNNLKELENFKIADAAQTILLSHGSGVMSNTLPLSLPNSNVEISFSVGGAASVALFISKKTFNGVKSLDDVAIVINKEIEQNSALSAKVVCEVRDGKISFRTTGTANHEDLTLNFVSGGAWLGFNDNVSYSGDGSCIVVELLNSSNQVVSCSVDLRGFVHSADVNTTVGDLLDEIIGQVNGLYTAALTVEGCSIKGHNGYQVKSIYGNNSYLLSAILGLAGDIDEDASHEFSVKKNNLEDPSNVAYSGFSLNVTQSLAGAVSVDATSGVAGMKITGDIDMGHTMSLTLTNLPDWEVLAKPTIIKEHMAPVENALNGLLDYLNETFPTNSLGLTENSSEEEINAARALVQNIITLIGNVESKADAFFASTSYQSREYFQDLYDFRDFLALGLESVPHLRSIDIGTLKTICSLCGVSFLNNAVYTTALSTSQNELNSTNCAVSFTPLHGKESQKNLDVSFKDGAQYGSIVARDACLSNALALSWKPSDQSAGIALQTLKSNRNNLNDLNDKLIESIKNNLTQSLNDSFFYGLDLPISGQSFADILGVSQKINDLCSRLERSNGKTIQECCSYVEKQTGITLTPFLNGDSIQINLCWNYDIRSQLVNLGNLAQGCEGFYFGGTLEAYLDASIKMNVCLTIPFSDNGWGDVGVSEITGKDFIDAEINIRGNNLSGEISAGYGEYLTSLLSVYGESYLYLNANCKASYSNNTINWTEAKLDASGKIYLQTMGMDAGFVDIDMSGAGLISILNKDISQLLSYDIPQNFAGDQTIVGIQNNTLYFDASNLKVSGEKTALFDKLRLVADSFSSVIRKAQSGINRELLSDTFRHIPLIGDSIVGAADCLTCLNEGFVEPFRKFVNKVTDMSATSVAEALARILGDRLESLESISATSILWAGKTFTNSYQGIHYYEDFSNGTLNEVGWRIRLCGDYSLDTQADFDLGFPGLGLHSSGGIDAQLHWTLDIGFGVSRTNGAFILLSNGYEDDLGDDENAPISEAPNTHAGDDLKVVISVSPRPDLEIDGSLGFLTMKAFIDEDCSFYSNNGFGVYLGVDFNDGSYNPDEDGRKDWKLDKIKNAQINVSELGRELSVETRVKSNLNLEMSLTLGGDAYLPSISADLEFDWLAETGGKQNGIQKLAFSNIEFNAGQFLDKVLGPIVHRIKEILEPIQPLIDFLQSEVPVLNKLPKGKVHITFLQLIQEFGKAKDMDLRMLEDLVALNNVVQNIGDCGDLQLILPNLVLVDALDSRVNDEFGKRFLDGKVGDIEGFVNDLITSLGITNSDISVAGFSEGTWDEAVNREFADFGENITEESDDSYGWSFPIFEEPLKEIVGLLLGRHSTLVYYDMHPFHLGDEFSKNYPIVGPLCVDIGFNFGVNIDLSFGYDTLGMESWRNSGFKDVGSLIDGFYVADWDLNGNEFAEVVFNVGIDAGVSLAGIAGVTIGVDLDVNLDMKDPNDDGKVRLGELIDILSLNPLDTFDVSADLTANAKAYLYYVIGKKTWTLWRSDALELYNTKSKDAEPVLATKQGDDLVVNIGEYAAKRNIGDLSDGDDSVTIEFTENNKCKITYGDNEKNFDVTGTLFVYAGKGNDNVTITGTSGCNVEIHGGAGNDQINLSGLEFAGSQYALIYGDDGNDIIKGAETGSSFIFGEGGRFKASANDTIAESYPTDKSSGNNVIVANGGKNYVFGGFGNDFIVGGDGEDYIFGDGGRITIGAAPAQGNKNNTSFDRYDLFDEGGYDVIFGGNGDDVLLAGAGSDTIDGGAGADEIHAGMGNDVVYGGSGTDKIYGDDGVDVIFGDKPHSATKTIADDATLGVLPYAYVSDELKKEGSLLNDSDSIKLFGFATKFNDRNSGAALTVEQRDIVGDYENGVADSGNKGDDEIYGGNGSDIIFGDDGADGASASGGSDVIEGGADNDFIDGDAGDDRITGGSGEDVIYGGQGNDILNGGAGNDIVFGDDGINGFATDQKGTSGLFANQEDSEARKNQGLVFGDTVNSFVNNFGIKADAKSNTSGGTDTIIAGNGSDIVDGQSGDDSYIVNMMGGGNRAYTNVMDSGENDASDSLTINGTVNADEFLIRASDLGLGMVASLPEIQTDPNSPASRTQIERVNFWNVGGEKTGVENLAVNAGAGDDKISIDGTLSTISIDAGAGNDTVTVGQMFDSKRTTDANLSNVQPKDVFGTTETTQGYLSNGVEHATFIVGGEGNDTFNVLHNKAAVSLSGGLGNDTFNVAMFQEKHEDETTSIVENSPVTLIGGAGIDKMSIAGSEGDDTFVISHGRIFGEGNDVQTVSVEDKNVYGGDGDDSFYVLDSEADEITKLYGNNGNDSFYNGGVGSADKPAFLTATAVDSGAINVVFVKADDTTKVLDTPTAVLPENGNAVDAYRVKLDRAPKAGETVTVTVFAPEATTEAHGRGDREIWLVDGSGKLCKSITFRFAATATGDGVVAWDSPQLVKMKAIGDTVREGDDYFSLLHNVSLTTTQTNVEASVVKTCKNALVFLDEPGTETTVDNKFSVTQEVVVTTSDISKGYAVVGLRSLPDAEEIDAWYMQNGAPVSISSLTRGANNELTIGIGTLNLASGTRIYLNYQQEHVLLVDESVVQMAYSTEGMTDTLVFVPLVYDVNLGHDVYDNSHTCFVYAESQLGTLGAVADDARYIYRTAGPQIIILDKVSLKPVSLKGNVSFQQVDGSIVYPQVTIYDEENSFQNVSKEEIAQHMQDNTIENIKGALYEDGIGKEFSLGDVGPEMLRYGTSTTPTTNDEKNAASAEDLGAWAAAAQTAAVYDESQSVDRVFTNNMGNAKAGVKNDLQALESVGTIDQSMIPVAGGSPVILNSLPDVQKQADTEWFNSDSESLRFTHKDLAATDENRINTGNIEYGEYNLGTGADTVDIYKSIYREDGFLTFTVMNSGEGGDTINVHSYQDGEDDQLVINAGEGNDTVDASGEDVTKKGLIVFGGLGDDTIDIGSDSSLVFGDRGQVLYHNDDGHVVTRLGDDRTGTPGVDAEDDEWNAGGSDYATGKNKDSEAYWQTDGVRRGPSIARTVTENQGGNDEITLADGRNVVFGGVGNDSVTTGDGKDLVFGDDGYATFGGHASIAEALGQDNALEVRTEATLSFNFQGASQTGLSSEAVAGALNATHSDDYRSANWNNVGGNLAGTYGNDDREIVRFDDGTRASAVSVSYGGIESHRNTDTDNRINLQAYGHNFANASTDADAALMNAGLMTTAPNAQCDNRLEVVVDGLAQYFTEYRVVVYLDIPDSHSAQVHSVRKVSLYVGDSSDALQSFYVDDAEGENFDGGYERATATTASAATYANYAVFTVSAASFADNFRVVIEDAFPDQYPTGKNLPGIAAIQVRGDLHAQDVAVSTQLNLGGDDIVSTGGSDDIVVGGAGSDYMATFGELVGGIRDNDLVFGDSTEVRFEDRLGTGDTMVASARSLDPDADGLVQGVGFDDRIVTGDGNDTVVGGLGGDRILAGSQSELTQLGIAQAFYGDEATVESLDAANGPAAIRDLEQLKDTTEEGRKVLSINFTTRGADDSTTASDHAGVVQDTGWNNLYLYNGHLYTREGGENSTTPVLRYSDGGTVTNSSVGISLTSYDSGTTDQGQNGSLVFRTSTELDGDTTNSRLFAGYTAAQQQQDIHVSLTNLSSFRGAGETCDVYVYLGADDSDTDAFSHIYEIEGSEDGSRYLNDWKGHAFDGDYREATCRDRAMALQNLAVGSTPMVELIGNYAVFHNVAGDTFDLYIRNLHTGNGQWPMNMPVIAAIQVVSGSGRADAAVGGDHDRDLVFGDSAALTFDMDVPYAAGEDLADFANINRVNGASSLALSDGLYALGADDTIYTGMDRDVVVAGEGEDLETLGSGDDVALGDNASLVLEHNNPVGVFRPDVETVLESNNYQADNAAYLGSPTVDAGDIQDKFGNGGVPGVTLEASANGGTDTFTDATDKDWTVQQEVTPSTISRTIDISSGAQVITFAESETVLLVSDTWPGNQWWHPNIVIVADGQGHSVPALAWEWDVNGTTMTASTQSGYYFTVDIPDTPNGDNRYEIRVTALATGTAVISIGA